MKQKKKAVSTNFLIIAALAAMLLAIPAMVQSKKGEAAKKAQTLDLRSSLLTLGRAQASSALPSFNRRLEVSFDYQRQAGPGSNQYAVWIEDEKGDVVKTLFVTSYTTKGRARGGEQPQRGYIVRPACVPTWVKTVKADEKTDEQGKAVPQGNYKVVVEATLFFDSDIIYSGTFSTKDNAGDIKLTSTLTKEDEQHKNMVTNVKASLK